MRFKLPFLLLLTALTTQAAGPGATNDFNGRRVLFIGIDGVRPDALSAANTPNIDALKAKGIITNNAFAGGILGTPTQQATSSGPGWSTLLTGVWVDKHNVTNNAFTAPNFQTYPHFFRRIKEAHPNAHLSSVIHWSPIDTEINEGSKNGNTEFLSYRKNVGTDALVASNAVTDIENSNPDAMFLHFDDVDHAGHASGYGVNIPAYITAIEGVDTHIGTVINAIKARPQYAQEDWLIIVSTDHGGLNQSHGGQSADERTIFLLVSGGNTPNGVISNASPGQTAIAPTAMKHLDIPVNPSWGWAESYFGIPSPTFDANAAGTHVILDWTTPAGGLAGLTGYEIRRDNATIATLPITATNFTDTPTFPANSQTTFIYEIRFLGTTEPALQDDVILGKLDLLSGLEMHLKFDDTTLDSTANNHNATAVGGPTYVNGIKGKAIVLDNTNYLTVPQLGGLRFGSNTDFTVSFWVKTTGQWAGDPSFISNKDWDSGNNQGWIIAAELNGPKWQWNLKGADGARADFDNGNTILDGKWHLITVSHDRDGLATFYQDGKSLGSVDISNDGDINTAFDLVIGRDGETDFPFSQAIHMDDLKIWTRALSATEVDKLSTPLKFIAWQEGNFTPTQLNDQQISGTNADPDSDGHSNLMEFALGGDPNSPDQLNPLTVTKNGNNYIASWSQRNGGSGAIGTTYVADGIIYKLQFTHDFLTWKSGSANVVEHSNPSFLNSERHTAQATLASDPPANLPIFFRLQILEE